MNESAIRVSEARIKHCIAVLTATLLTGKEIEDSVFILASEEKGTDILSSALGAIYVQNGGEYPADVSPNFQTLALELKQTAVPNSEMVKRNRRRVVAFMASIEQRITDNSETSIWCVKDMPEELQEAMRA